jgi:hypothetical protein
VSWWLSHVPLGTCNPLSPWVLHECQFGSSVDCILGDLCLLTLSITEKGVSKSLARLEDLSVLPVNAIHFVFN